MSQFQNWSFSFQNNLISNLTKFQPEATTMLVLKLESEKD